MQDNEGTLRHLTAAEMQRIHCDGCGERAQWRHEGGPRGLQDLCGNCLYAHAVAEQPVACGDCGRPAPDLEPCIAAGGGVLCGECDTALHKAVDTILDSYRQRRTLPPSAERDTIADALFAAGLLDETIPPPRQSGAFLAGTLGGRP